MMYESFLKVESKMNNNWEIRSRVCRVLAALSVCALVACGGGGGGTGGGTPPVNDDNDNGNGSATNTAPTARAGQNITITAGGIAQFDASASSDSDGQIVSYQWSNGLQGAVASQPYNVAGTYPVTLTVTDDDGASDSDSLIVTVQPAPTAVKPERIEIQGSTQLIVGQAMGLRADVIYSDGTVRNDVQWSSSASDVASVSAFGVVNAHKNGQVVVTAMKQHEDGNVSASFTITVVTSTTPPIIDRVEISGPTSVGIGSSIQLSAAIFLNNGNSHSNNNVTWSSSNAGIASVNAQGLVVGEGAGTALITATTVDGPNVMASVEVSVTTDPVPFVTSISITGPSSVTVGGSISLSAQVNYSDGASTNSVNWSVDNPSIATVSNSGVVTASNFGDVTVSAEQGGVTEEHDITVLDGDTDLVSIEIFPKSLRLNSSETTQQAVAVGTNVDGDKFPLTHLVEWSTSNESIAQVSDTGEVTIVNADSGTVELSASFTGVSGSFTIDEQGRSFAGSHVFFQKPDDWQEAYLYIWVNGGASEPRGGWPGTELDAVEEVGGWYHAQILPEYISDDGLVYFKFTSQTSGAQQSPSDLEMDPASGHLWFTDAASSTDVPPEWMGSIAGSVEFTVAGNEIAYSDANPGENLAGQSINAGVTLNIQPGALPQGRTFKNWGGSAALYVVDPTAENTRIVIANVEAMELEAEFNIEVDDGHGAGRSEYAAQCESCHGKNGVGEGVFSAVTLEALQASWAEDGETLSIASLASYIESTMPFGSDSVNCTGLNEGDCAYDIAAMIFADAWVNQNSLVVGGDLYEESCASCHGEDGEGSPGIFPSLHNCTTCSSATTLATFIELAMPPVNQSGTTGPHQCDADCANAIADYILATFTGEDGPYACQSDDYRSREVRLLSQTEYQNTIQQLFLLEENELPNTDFLKRTLINGFENNSEIGVVSANVFESALNVAGEIVAAASGNQYLGCEASSASCVLDNFGLKVFRRPMSATERSRYESLFNEYGADTAIQAMLASSSFLYRTELGANNGAAITTLTDYEIASALSYAILASAPDDTLLEAAGAGELHTSAQISAQVQRLLSLPEARTNIGRFVAQWLGSEAILNINKEEAILSPSLREAMLQETQDFAAHVVFDGTGRYSELMTADYTIASEELAQYYGLDGNGGVTPYEPNTRSGVLGHASILSTFSSYDQTSPIKRGLFVRSKLLCQTFPEPPDDVVVMAPRKDDSLTTRERFALHTENPVCQSCHQYIDELGFGFENFDTYGRHRIFENGTLIDASGDLNNVEDLTGEPVSNLFDDINGLADIVSESDSGKACYALNYYRYTYGTTEDDIDGCNLSPLSEQFIESDGDIRDFMERLLSDESFITRKRTL